MLMKKVKTMSNTVTDINKLKEIALNFLDLDPTPVEKYPFIVIHPYFTDRIMAKYKDDGQGIESFDILECPDKFEHLKKHIRDSITNGDIDTIFARMLPKYYLTFLKFSKSYMSKNDFERYLAYSWVMAENPNQDINVDISTLIKWFRSADRKNIMEDDELEYYNSLPDTVTIYRGIAIGRAEQNGLSWTCNRKTAEWFANRFNIGDEKGYVLKGVIDKKDIFAYFNGRDEDEICCNSHKVRDIEIEKL